MVLVTGAPGHVGRVSAVLGLVPLYAAIAEGL